MTIKVVSWDVYGTLIETLPTTETDCEDEPIRPRPRALEILTEIKRRGLIQVTSSDGNLKELNGNLSAAGIDRAFFADLYELNQIPKDYSFILEDFGIMPQELMVIGDNYRIDVKSARQQGCQAIWVPEYEHKRVNPLNIRRILKQISLREEK